MMRDRGGDAMRVLHHSSGSVTASDVVPDLTARPCRARDAAHVAPVSACGCTRRARGVRGGAAWCTSLFCHSRPVALLCLYVSLKSMKPSELYLTPYLIDVKGFSQADTYEEIYPVWTYSAAAMCFLAFLFTDVLGYRTMVQLEACAYLATRVLLVWGSSLLAMQATQFFYAVATSTELGYFSYVFAVSRPEDYQRVTCAATASMLLAQLLAAGIAQLAVSGYGNAALLPLNYVSMASVMAACVVAACLPRVVTVPWYPAADADAEDGLVVKQRLPGDTDGGTVVSAREGSRGNPAGGGNPGASPLLVPTRAAKSAALPGRDEMRGVQPSLSMLSASSWRAFRLFYGQWHNVRWSLWAAAGMCGLYQVENYNQNLWQAVTHGRSRLNGAMGMLATLLGVAATLAPASLGPQSSLLRRPEAVLAVLSMACGVLLFAMGSVDSAVVGYGGFVAFKAVFLFTSTVAAAQVARGAARTLPGTRRRFGMVYGFNTLLALLLEAALQLAVGPHGMGLDVRRQFQVYGGYFGVMGATFAFAACLGAVWRRMGRSNGARGYAVGGADGDLAVRMLGPPGTGGDVTGSGSCKAREAAVHRAVRDGACPNSIARAATMVAPAPKVGAGVSVNSNGANARVSLSPMPPRR